MKFLRFLSDADKRARIRRLSYGRYVSDPHNELINREFDETRDEDIAALAAEIGASGARRPPSE